MSKVNSINIIISALILLVLLVYFSYLKEGKTQANSVSLEGWAWIGADCVDPNESSCDLTTLPVGWISFSSNNPEITCKNITYGVNINTSTGEISGSAWIGVGEDDITTDCNKTENTVGWLDFDSNQTPTCGQNGYPSDYCFPAKLDLVSNEIQGWAPIISKDFLGNTTTVTWVRFKGNNYGVTFDPNNRKLSGYAWSGWGKDGGLGWIYFLTTLPVSKALLIVQSSPITGISITANPSQFGGTTNYSVSSTNPISASLTAPMNFGSYEFERWQGCDSASNNVCNVSINTGEVQIVQAIYTTPPPPPSSSFDLSVTSLDIRTFICKNKNLDISLAQEYIRSGYQFPASTTYAGEFYNRVASSTCPESQRNRPVEFSATGECRTGTCPEWKLRIDIISNSPLSDRETTSSETTSNGNHTKSIQFIYTFDKPYDYTVRACVLDQNNRPITDTNPNNNCKEQTLRIFDYMCLLGFCTQAQRDINNPSTLLIDLQYKILQTFKDTDAPCRFWRNEICRAQFGF